MRNKSWTNVFVVLLLAAPIALSAQSVTPMASSPDSQQRAP